MKKKLRICIVRSKYNNTSKILKSAVNELIKRKVIFKILEVPGAFEIPVVVARNIKKYDGDYVIIFKIIKYICYYYYIIHIYHYNTNK